MAMTAAEIARATGGRLLAGDPGAAAATFAIDSRVLVPGEGFVALVAGRDGHDFVSDAFAAGASVALVTRPVATPPPPGAAIVLVDDALRALGILARRRRDALGASHVIGITGSAGKTGTKDLTRAALSTRRRVHASPASFNNEAGLPMTLLAAPADVDALVLEMGARAHGDIAALCHIARPNVGVITNIGWAHAGPLGGQDGIARVKGELLEALPATGLAVLDAGDAFTPALIARTAAEVLLVSTAGHDVPVRVRDLHLDEHLAPAFVLDTDWGSAEVRLSVRGAHQATNAALAAGVALHAGVPVADVAAGLATAEPAASRLDVVRSPEGWLVLDDSYNANPGSMRAALAALGHVDVPGRHIAVLGDMRELGDASEREHAALGDAAADVGVDVLVAVGDEIAPTAARAHARGVSVVTCADAAAAVDAIRAVVRPGDVVLVKGSRAVGLETVATALGGTGDDDEDGAP